MKLSDSRRALRQIEDALGYVGRDRRPEQPASRLARKPSSSLVQGQPLVGQRTKIAGVRRIYLTPYLY